MSTVRDPLRDLLKLQERMNRLFEQTLSRGGASEEDLQGGGWTPPVDIEETPARIVLRADLPGIHLGQLELKIQDDSLILRGDRRFDPKSRREDFHRIERPFGSFHRSFALPRGIDQGGVRAELKNGVLEVVLPKKTDAQTKNIEVAIR